MYPVCPSASTRLESLIAKLFFGTSAPFFITPITPLSQSVKNWKCTENNEKLALLTFTSTDLLRNLPVYIADTKGSHLSRKAISLNHTHNKCMHHSLSQWWVTQWKTIRLSTECRIFAEYLYIVCSPSVPLTKYLSRPKREGLTTASNMALWGCAWSH